MQLSPNENYPIFHGIINHLDTDTYYVRTVIYDADYNLLATVDLEDQGSQNFLKIWKVPYDNIFQRGKFILLVTSTYTDSGYTTKSENYGDEFQTHLVQERWDMSKISSVGGGGITTKDVKKVIKKELENIKFPKAKDIKFPKQTEYEANFKDITKELDKIKTLVGTLPAQNNDLRPIVSRLNELSQEVKTKPVTKETNLKPILKLLDKHHKDKSNSKEIKGVSNILDEIKSRLNKVEKELLKNVADKVTKIVADKMTKIVEDEIKKLNITIPANLLAKGEDEKKSNINKLKSKYGI